MTSTPSPPVGPSPWAASLVADGPASLEKRHWPVLLILANTDDCPHGLDPGAVLQVRVRASRPALSLCVEDRPAPGPRVRVEPGGELRVPLNLLDRIQLVSKLKPGAYRVSLLLRTEQGILRVPTARLVLGS